MDEETKEEFEKVTTLLGTIHTDFTSHIAYSKGLNLDKRVPICENKIECLGKGKASWGALYLITGLLIGMFGLVITVAQVIK